LSDTAIAQVTMSTTNSQSPRRIFTASHRVLCAAVVFVVTLHL
jgi:hypothetical protein